MTLVIIEYKSIFGPKKIYAPSRLDQDCRACVSAWVRMLDETREMQKNERVPKSHAYIKAHAKRAAYSLVLADTCGLSPSAWEQDAKIAFDMEDPE